MGASQSLLANQLANELAGPLAIVCRYVEMGDRPDHERAKRGNQDSTLRRDLPQPNPASVTWRPRCSVSLRARS